MTNKSPRGRIPAHVKEWMRENSEIPREMLLCPKCGRWWQHIDDLAPYHWEQCKCGKCGVMGGQV